MNENVQVPYSENYKIQCKKLRKSKANERIYHIHEFKSVKNL